MSTTAARVWTCDRCGAETVVRGTPSDVPATWGRVTQPVGWWVAHVSRSSPEGEGTGGVVTLCPDHRVLGEAWAVEMERWRARRSEVSGARWTEAQREFARLFTEPVAEWERGNPRPVLELGRVLRRVG